MSQVRLRGSVGDLENGKVNRDGTGAILFFTPKGGQTVIIPQAGGQLHGDHDKTHTFGMGESSEGELEVMWPGKVYNKMKVCHHDLKEVHLWIYISIRIRRSPDSS